MQATVNVLANGFVWVRDLASGLCGTYTRSGEYLHGDLRGMGALVRAKVGR